MRLFQDNVFEFAAWSLGRRTKTTAKRYEHISIVSRELGTPVHACFEATLGQGRGGLHILDGQRYYWLPLEEGTRSHLDAWSAEAACFALDHTDKEVFFVVPPFLREDEICTVRYAQLCNGVPLGEINVCGRRLPPQQPLARPAKDTVVSLEALRAARQNAATFQPE